MIFFGVLNKNQVGHHFYGSTKEIMALPFDKNNLDGIMKSSDQSKATMIHFTTSRGGWTVLSMADYTGDSRGGSNAAFIVEGIVSFDDVIDQAKIEFPEQYKRINDVASICLI